MVTGTLEEDSLDIHGVIGLHLTNSFGDCAPLSQLPRFSRVTALTDPVKRPPYRVAFFVYDNATNYRQGQINISSPDQITAAISSTPKEIG